MSSIGSYGKKQMVRVRCTDTGKTLDAEVIKLDKDKLTVVLPGFIKMILNKTSKPHFYTTNQSGMEFTCNTQDK